MGRLTAQETLFCRFRIEGFVTADHLLDRIGRRLDIGTIPHELAALYSHSGRSIRRSVPERGASATKNRVRSGAARDGGSTGKNEEAPRCF